jgi:hypothetical protein
MTTVSEVMDEVALACGVAIPGSWIAATTKRTYLELHAILRATVRELLDRVDWPDPISLDSTITGTGATSYDLPAAFRRLTFDDLTVYETTTDRRPCIPVTSNGAWTHLNEVGSAGGERFYKITGNDSDGYDIAFYRALESGSVVKVSYVSQNWLKHDSVASDEWEGADDTLLLPRELVRLGVTWRFKQQKGLPYENLMGEYEGKLARLANESRGRRTIDFSGSLYDAKPMRVPVPDYIPTS